MTALDKMKAMAAAEMRRNKQVWASGSNDLDAPIKKPKPRKLGLLTFDIVNLMSDVVGGGSVDETWLICGGRDFHDKTAFEDAMDQIIRVYGCPARIIHGAAKGADTLAGGIGKRLSIDVVSHPANWKKHGRAAGIIRNREMLESNPDKVIAFPGGRGTKNMSNIAKDAGITLIKVRVM